VDIEAVSAQPFGGYTVDAKVKDVAFKKSEIMKQAMERMERDINLAGFERKENESLLDEHFNSLIAKLQQRKAEIVLDMNQYYDSHQQDSRQRINALNAEFEKQLELEKDVNYNEVEQQMQAQMNDNNSNLIKRQFLKLRSKMNVDDDAKNAAADDSALAAKAHDKLRVFFPMNTLKKVIEEEIRVGSDWWNTLKLDHNEFSCHDSSVWRKSNYSLSGWFNAFGSCKVSYTQKKRWNLRILPRENCDLKQAADVVIGVVDAEDVDKLFQKNKGKGKKASGFWQKGFGGYGFYGWNGKLFYSQHKRGSVYGQAYNVNDTIGVELDMTLKIEKEGSDGQKKKKASSKSGKAKTNTIKNIRKGVMIASGATINFFVNGEDKGVAFYDLDISKEYVLAVGLNSSNYILKLMD